MQLSRVILLIFVVIVSSIPLSSCSNSKTVVINFSDLKSDFAQLEKSLERSEWENRS